MADEAGKDITWPYVHRFKSPVKVLDDTHDSITLREPVVRDLLDFGILDGMPDASKMVDFIARLAGGEWNAPKLERMPARDFLSLSRLVTTFLLGEGA